MQAKWHFVVLQEQSMRPIEDPENLKRYGRLFDEEIKKSRCKDGAFSDVVSLSPSEKLTNAYMSMRKELNVMNSMR